MNEPIHCGDEPLRTRGKKAASGWCWSPHRGGWEFGYTMPNRIAVCPSCGKEWELVYDHTGLTDDVVYCLRDFSSATVEEALSFIGDTDVITSEARPALIHLRDAALRLMVTEHAVKKLLGDPIEFQDVRLSEVSLGYEVTRVSACVGSRSHLRAVVRRRKTSAVVRNLATAILEGRASPELLRQHWRLIVDDDLPEMLVVALSAL